MASLTGSTGRPARFLANCTIRCSKPIAFPDASKAASTLLGYGRTAQVIPGAWTLWVGCPSFLSANLPRGGTSLELRAVVRCLGKMLYSWSTISVDYILARSSVFLWKRLLERINGGKVAPQEFTAAMANMRKSLDINLSSTQTRFQNRMISCRMEFITRSRNYWCTSGFWKGLIVDQNGLFAGV